ncbi:MAG TPA: hypothetical protein VMN56_01410 [Casimicrobiaceae bacterium]|nr:hypothetical protein [Casimicrobiaceae bacterium]
MNNNMKLLALVLSLNAVACGGAPFTLADGPAPAATDSGMLGTTPPPAPDAGRDDAGRDDAGHDAGADDAAPSSDDAGKPVDDAGQPVPDAADGGVSDDAAPADDAAPPALCCVEALPGDGMNTHCGIGAHAACTTSQGTSYDSADCDVNGNSAVGSACRMWPSSYGSPRDCVTGEPCCVGVVRPCK